LQCKVRIGSSTPFRKGMHPMARLPKSDSRTPPEFSTIALVLQGGGALGSYQAGVYEALASAGVSPNWVSGISIGAINSALIVGNPPEKRVERLREFWETVSEPPLGPFGMPYDPSQHGLDPATHKALNSVRAFGIAMLGAPGFFTPRFPSPQFLPSDDLTKLSYYDVAPLRATLERLVDFDRINAGATRMSVGAVNIRTGNFVYFDTTTHKLDARHIMASGSLPPGFPATEIDGEYYWDGGIVSNTPLQWVLESRPRQDTLAFQIDLWSASGRLPKDLTEADVRQKEIRFASRTRAATDQFRNAQRLRRAFRDVYEQLPAAIRKLPEVALLDQESGDRAYNVVNLIYHARSYEGVAKDYEFSRLTMEEHWRSGLTDAERALSHPEILKRPSNGESFQAFDFARGRDAAG
jgi:NTE family protein